MTTWGADADELEAAAAELVQDATYFEQTSKGLRGLLYNVAWKGHFADEFRLRWDGHHLPQLTTTSSFLRDMSTRLKTNADQQRTASGATSGALTAAATAAVGSRKSVGRQLPARPATDEETTKAFRDAGNTIRAAQKAMPKASEVLREWEARLRQGHPSVAELQAFVKYRETLVAAMSFRATVLASATDGIEAYRAALKSGASTVIGVLPLGETGLGKFPASAAASHGATIASVEMVGKAGDGAVDAGLGAGTDWYLDHALKGLQLGDPQQLLRAYDARADAYLAGVASRYQGSTNMSAAHPELARTNAISAFEGQHEVATASDTSSAFNLGPLGSALGVGMDVLVPGSGKATFGVLGDLETNAHMSAAAGYMNLAVDGGFSQLLNVTEAMQL